MSVDTDVLIITGLFHVKNFKFGFQNLTQLQNGMFTRKVEEESGDSNFWEGIAIDHAVALFYTSCLEFDGGAGAG